MKKIIFACLLLLFAVIYFTGPKPAKTKWNFDLIAVPEDPTELERFISHNESKHPIKPDNHARIIWADSAQTKTEYAVVYLHGFTASWKEGDPVHKQFAKAFGCNLFLSRLSDHGIDTTETLLNFTIGRYWESVKVALAIGNVIGKKVILLSTSTGGTAALMLAAHYPDKVYALINMSPNIELNNSAAFILNDPWGLQLAQLFNLGNYKVEPEDGTSGYWINKYRLEAAVQLEQLLEETMTAETFQNVRQPSLTLCYFKNEEEQDPVVKVSAIKKMHWKLGTPPPLKSLIQVSSVGAHAMGSDMRSKDVSGVLAELEKFAGNALKMKKTRSYIEVVNNRIEKLVAHE